MRESSVQQRETKQRREVFEAVVSRCNHPSADDIYLDVRQRDDKISRGTVYRNLKVLSDNDEIMYVRAPGSDRYDNRLDNHYHLICSMCGKVIDAPIDYIDENDFYVEKNTGFKIKRHRTIFEGICPECQKNEEEN